jgi:pimeloyl-ACP methyl ester carboxylesterase
MEDPVATHDITPFRIDVPEADLADLHDRLGRTRWPDRETVADWSQGAPLGFVQDLCAYWDQEYDWRAREGRLNSFPQFRTMLDGLGIHFLHVRSPRDDALPLLLTHGWPGSVVEFLEVIGPLTDPGAHGGDPGDAFHVVCPSLPGYGFSDHPTHPGWGVDHIADAWDELMVRLGYPRYGAQGGDWGSAITHAIGVRHADHVAGIHLNMVVAGPGRDGGDDLTDRERDALAATARYLDDESGYNKQQSTRPQTLGYGLADSPAAQCAWIAEKFWSWSDHDGDPFAVMDRDAILDDVMLYWLNDAGTSSARLYWESGGRMREGTVTVPTGCTVFPKEIVRPSRRWAERVYPDLRWWDEPERGGHFAAFEQPEIFVEQVRGFFRLVR